MVPSFNLVQQYTVCVIVFHFPIVNTDGVNVDFLALRGIENQE